MTVKTPLASRFFIWHSNNSAVQQFLQLTVSRLTVKNIRLTTECLAVLRLTVNTIETLFYSRLLNIIISSFRRRVFRPENGNLFLCCRVRSFLVSTVTRTTQKLLRFQAPSQATREPTSVPARVELVVETLICTVTFTTGSVQPKTWRIITF